MLDSIWQDLRNGFRVLTRRPGLVMVALPTLALGIGITTTIFSFADAVLLKPLPYRDPDRIVRVLETRPSGVTSWVSTLDYLDWKDQNTVFEHLAAEQRGVATITGRDEPLPVNVGRVSANYFDVFGVKADLGRLFAEGEDQPGSEHVVILSHELWQTEYGGDASMIGDSILVDDEPYVLVGVLPEDSSFNRTGIQIWHPLALQTRGASRSYRWINSTVGLLRPGISLEQARAELRAIGARIANEYPDSNRDWSVAVDSYEDTIVSAPLRTSLLVLIAAVAALFMICCANLASLLLARAVARMDEVVLRVSLGATTLHIARQFFFENLILALAGGALGIGVAWAGIAWIQIALPPDTIPSEARVVLDARVLMFAIAVSVASALGFGLAPFIRTNRSSKSAGTGGGNRNATASRQTRRLLDSLVVGEVALSVVLALSATLLIRSFVGLMNVDTGFDTDRALAMRLPVPGFPPGSIYTDPTEFQAYVREIVATVEAIPGVSAAAMTSALPLTDCCLYLLNVQVEGRPPPDRADLGGGFFKIATPSYLSALGLNLLEGRFLSEQDTANARPVIVINKRLADRFFPGESPLGRRILNPEILPGRTQRGDLIAWEVVGIVADETITSLDDESSAVAYASYEQSPVYFANLVVTTEGDPAALENDVRNALRRINPSQSVLDARTLAQIRSESASGSRFQTVLLSSFSAIAVLFASVGLFGILTYSVALRSREIGIRAALGATRMSLLAMVLRRGIGVTALGLAIGLAVAYAVMPLMRGILYGVDARDPYTVALVSLTFLIVSLVASLAPALRAARIDLTNLMRAGIKG